jgi:hypothetical protein
MTRKDDPYRAYLLRCWRESDAGLGGRQQWRFSVEEVLHERRRTGFTSLEALMTFLRAELSGSEGEWFEEMPSRQEKQEGGADVQILGRQHTDTVLPD